MEGTYSEDFSLSVVFSVLSLLSTESCLAHGIQAETGSASNSSPSLSLSLSVASLELPGQLSSLSRHKHYRQFNFSTSSPPSNIFLHPTVTIPPIC